MATKRLRRWRVVVICHEFMRYKNLLDFTTATRRPQPVLGDGRPMTEIRHQVCEDDSGRIEASVVWYADFHIRAAKGEEYETAEQDVLQPMFAKSRKVRPALSLSNWHISEVKPPRGRRAC